MRISDWSSDVCSSDLTDAQIENKLGRLEELLNNADHTSANLLGIEPGIFGEKLVGEGDGSPGPDSGEPPMPTPNIGPRAGTPAIGGDVREFSTEYDRRYAAEVQQEFNQGATRQPLDDRKSGGEEKGGEVSVGSGGRGL